MDGPSEAGVFLGGPLIVALFTACALSRLAQRDANWVSFLTSVLGVTLACSIVAVVPYDVWQALQQQGQEGREPEPPSLLRRSWTAIYWTTTVLCCFLCPVLIEFEASGDFTVAARLRNSLWRNAVIYVAYLVFGALVLVWLLVRGTVQGNLESWCIAASNAWGLLLLTVLMGFGLVAVPRHLWRLADPSEQLQTLYAQVLAKDEERLSRLFELQDTLTQVRGELAACLTEDSELGADDSETRPSELAVSALQRTLERCEEVYSELTRSSRSCEADGVTVQTTQRSAGSSPVSTPRSTRSVSSLAERLKRVAKLHGKLKVAGLEARRAASRWETHVRRCLFFEDLAGCRYKAAAELLGLRPRASLPCGCCPGLRQSLRNIWCRLLTLWLESIRTRVLKALSYASGLLSVIIVLGQLTMFAESWSLSLLAVPFREDHGPWLTQLLCVAPLGYMTYTAYFSVFRMKIAGWYGLYGNHNTDSGSLLWCASLLARLAGPLCYHFLLLIRVRGTTFQSFMGRMNVVPVLGESVNEIFPCFVAVLCGLNLLNVYSRILPYLSLGVVEVEPTTGPDEDPLAEGRQRLERERRRLAEEFLELPSRAAAVDAATCGANPQRLAVPLAAPAG
uniref:Uncharacterized protein n=1 Tax=Alexandrium monilatum TaxID=311494 RepID=A0A7S4T5L1_9DINO